MDVVWGIVGTLVYIMAVFIAVEFCCGRIKKYSSAKREEEEEGSGRRESATAAATDDVPGATAAAETSAEAEAVVEKPSSDEERIRTAADDASEVPPEPEVTIDIHKEPPMPEKAIPDIIPEPENIPEPESIPEPENIPVDVHVKNEEETLETVPKEPKIQQVVEPEVEEVEPKVEEIEPEIVDVEPEVVEVKPAVVEAEQEIAEVEPEVEEVEPEGEDEGDAAVAATKIQAGFRGHQSRKRVKKLKEEKDAATKIQAGFRGWKSRKQVSVKRRGAPGVEVEADDHLTEEPPAAVTEEDTSLSMPSDVTEQHVAKETASAIELPPAMFAADMSPVEETAPEVPSPVVESTPTELFAKQPDVTPPASPEVTQPEIAETPSPTEAESPETSSPEEISPAPFSKPIPPTPPPTPADVDLFAGGTEATEPTSGTDPVLEGGEIVLGDVEPAMVKAVAEKLDVLEKETVEASEKILYQPGTEVSFVVAPPLQPVSMETVAMEETDSSPDSAEQSPVTVVEAKTLIKQESEVYPYVEETQTSEEFDPESLIAQAVSSKSSSAAAAPEVVVTSERTVTMETGPDGKTTQTVVKVEHTVVKEITTVVTPKTTEVVTTEERTATSVSSDERSSEEQVTVVEASDDDTFEESGLEHQQGEMGMMMRSSGPKDKGAQLDRTGASFTDKWEPEPGES